MAARHWLARVGAGYGWLKPVYLGGDLYSRQPMCEAIKAIGGSFLLISTLVGNYHEMSPMMQGFLGLGLVSGGVGGGALVALVANWVARALIRYARLHFRLFDTATQSI